MATNDPASIDRQIDKTLDKSVAATTRIIETVLDTEDIAGQTAAKLHEQGKQIDGIHAKVVGIEEGAREARIEASKLEWCGCWYRCCHGKKAYTRSSGDSNDGAVTSEPRPHSMGGRITEKILENDSREKKIEDNLQDVRNALGYIESTTDDIGKELDRQNEEIEDITGHAQKTNEELKKTTEIAKKHT